MFTIEMLEYSEKNFPKEPGKYLIKTISTGPLKTIQYLQVRVAIVNNKASIDVNNQIITHISKEKLQ